MAQTPSAPQHHKVCLCTSTLSGGAEPGRTEADNLVLAEGEDA
jgi:hypothetical protein